MTQMMTDIETDIIKEDRIQYFYDIETLNNHFSIAFADLEHKIINVVLHHDKKADELYDYDELVKGIQDAFPDYHIRPIHHMSNREFADYFTNEFIAQTKRSEWLGWNSKNYDLMMMSAILTYRQHFGLMPDTQLIRNWSDLIIVEGFRYPRAFFPQLEVPYYHTFSNDSFDFYNKCKYSLNHIDVGALNEKSLDNSKQSFFPFPLKVIQSYLGLDVIDDDIVKGDGSFSEQAVHDELATSTDGYLTQKGMLRFLIYNINDVISTGIIFEEPEYKGSLRVLDDLRDEFPFLNKTKLERDATSAQYAGKIIRGEQNLKLKDFDEVSLLFPFPNGKWYNLLDVIEKRESNINPRVVEFYRHVEGKSLKTLDESNLIKESTLTGKTTINIPYLDNDGNATSAYITLSWGGSHGGIIQGSYARRLDRDEDVSWFREFETASVSDLAATVDIKDVIAVDFDSYYPTLNIMLKVYKKAGFIDNYAEVRRIRYALKDRAGELYKISDDKYLVYDRRQKAYKLVLNSATGASNQQKEYVDLPLDNATMSMRIIGNLLIYTLGQRLANKGGLIISTNTDGIFVANLSMEEVKDVTDEFESHYGLGLEPELVNRMINKSANERIEYDGKNLNIGGTLNRSLGDKINLQARLNYPRVCGKAVINYIMDNEMWLHEPLSTQKLKNYIIDEYNNFKPIDWTITLKGNKERIFYVEDIDNYQIDAQYHSMLFDTKLKQLQPTNRIILTKDGKRIIQKMKGKIEKITGVTSNIVTTLNLEKELNDVDSYKERIDLDAYTQWSMNMLKNWHVPAVIPELDDNEIEHNKQLSIDDLL